MPKKTTHQSIPCDTVFALSWDNDMNGWTISDTLSVWHEVAQPQDLYHVLKSEIRQLKELRAMSFTDLFTKMIFCVQDEMDVLYILAPFAYNPDDIAFVITDGAPPVVSSPSA